MPKSKRSVEKSVNQTTRKTNRQEEQESMLFQSVLAFLRYHSIGRLLCIIFLATLIILINILLSGNELELFSLILGIELIVLMIAGWSRYLIKRGSVTEQAENEANHGG